MYRWNEYGEKRFKYVINFTYENKNIKNQMNEDSQCDGASHSDSSCDEKGK